jgi:hypothetical protein
MNRMFVLVLVLVSGCNKPALEVAPVVATVTAPATTTVATPAPAAVVEAPKAVVEAPKPPPFTEDRCEKIIMPFRKCGWKCMGTGRGSNRLGRCVNQCELWLRNKEERRCVHTWGPMFG